MNRLLRAGHFLSDGLLSLAALMLASIVGINAVNVIGRYVFSSALAWGEEVMLFLMIAGVFLAFVKVTIERDHIRMDLLLRMLPHRVRIWLEALVDAAVALTCATIVVVGAPIIAKLYQFRQTSDASGLPIFIPQLSVPLGLGLAAFFLLLSLARRLSSAECNADLKDRT